MTDGVSGTLADTTARRAWRQYRGPLLIGGIVFVLGLAYAIVSAGNTGSPMDPRSGSRDGARALAVLLAERGVEVERVDRLDDALAETGPNDTLLVTVPDLLVSKQVDRLAGSATRHLVLFEPGELALAPLVDGNAVLAGTAFDQVREPECALQAARRAGQVDTGGRTYRVVDGDGTSCYGDSTRGSLVRVSTGDRTVDLVGAPSAFDNNHLDQEGHAALGLGLLGEQRRLVWYVPSPLDIPDAERTGLWSLLPNGVRYGFGAVAVAVVLLMVAAARRLGPVVPEPLPVVVRASEATEGRARLYRRLRARDRAAAELRTATAERLRSLLGLPASAADATGTTMNTERLGERARALPGTTGSTGSASEEPNATMNTERLGELVAAVAHRTGRDPAEVARLLGEWVPADDGELVRLADTLDALEQEVRRS